MLTSSLLTLLVLAVEPKALYESENDQEFWDVPVYAEHTFVWANRVYVDARFVDHNGMRLLRVEMSCPWLDNR